MRKAFLDSVSTLSRPPPEKLGFQVQRTRVRPRRNIVDRLIRLTWYLNATPNRGTGSSPEVRGRPLISGSCRHPSNPSVSYEPSWLQGRQTQNIARLNLLFSLSRCNLAAPCCLPRPPFFFLARIRKTHRTEPNRVSIEMTSCRARPFVCVCGKELVPWRSQTKKKHALRLQSRASAWSLCLSLVSLSFSRHWPW